MSRRKVTIVFPPSGKDTSVSCILVPAGITLIIMGVLWYFWLPPINLKAFEFWVIMIIALVVYMGVKILYGVSPKRDVNLTRPAKAIGIMILAMTIVMISGSKLFNAKRYSSILTVTEGTIDDIPSVERADSIALMDTASAEKLGDRRIGSLTDVVSQFNVGSYVQINQQEIPVKVAPLEYAGFFKWQSNNENGIPGYVVVNPVDMSADYVSLKNGLKYVPSAYLQEDLYRHIRMKYPTVMLGNLHFEIDEEGNPWYAASIYDHKVSLFGGTQVTGLLLIDPVSGEISRYAIEDVPQWVDVVFSGDLICEQYNNHAQLQNGFWNSIFTQTDCRQVTSVDVYDSDGDVVSSTDYGYIAMNGDIWIYTGITSVNGDSSNLGFILSNERTEETRYIACAGADEISAMNSAQGEVQEKRYSASFPSLINMDGVPTYIMVLKDSNGLVRMYAAVNVEQYNVVATGTSQEECLEKYRNLIHTGVPSDTPTDSYTAKTITVMHIEKIDVSGDTYLYLADEENNIYAAKYADVIQMMFVNEGDTITILTDGYGFTYPAE